MTKCPKCGYENPPEALSCGLCQEVLRKEKPRPAAPGHPRLAGAIRAGDGDKVLACVLDGLLLGAVRELPPGIGPDAVALAQDTQAAFLTTVAEDGRRFLFGFTDPAAVRAYKPDAAWLGMRAGDFLQTALRMGLDGVVLNPAGPYFVLEKDDLVKLLLKGS